MDSSDCTKKKTTRRDSYQYPAVENSQNLKSRQDDINDVQSYFGSLAESDKEWMNKFMSEYNNAEGVGAEDTEALHNTEELRKACRDRNNARNRCLYTQEKAQDKLRFMERIEELEGLPVDVFSKPVKKKRKK